MFCTSLRHRASITHLVPTLTSPTPTGLALKESALRTHDLALPITLPGTTTPQRLLVLLLTPTSATPATLPDTLSRVARFSALTPRPDKVIAFNLTPDQGGLSTYAVLTAALFAHPGSAPVVVIPSPAALVPVLRAYGEGMSVRSVPVQREARCAALLGYVSVDAPLGEEVVVGLSDAFEDMRDLVRGAVGEVDHGVSSSSYSEDGETRLERAVGNGVAKGVRDFWREEYVAE